MPRRLSLNVQDPVSASGFRSSRIAVRPSLAAVFLTSLLVLALGFVPTHADEEPCHCPQPGTHPGEAPTLEIGSVTVYPGTTTFSVPIYLTSSDEVTDWQMGLDYDDLLLTVDDIEIADTESENYGGSIAFVESQDGSFLEVSTEYDSGVAGDGPLPAGERLVVARILFTADRVPSTVNLNLRITSDDDFAVSVNDTTSPTTVDGVVSLLAGNVLEIGGDTGTVYDVFRMPVYMWSDSEASELYMGLDYDDLLLSRIDLEGGPMEDMDTEDYIIDSSEVEGGCTFSIQFLNGVVIDSEEDQFLFTLEFELERARHGEVPVALSSANLNAGEVSIPNLLDSPLTVLDHFIRGDVDIDERITILDGTRLLRWLFVEGAEPLCLDAADADANGKHQLADPIYLFTYSFKDGPAPAAPFPDAGPAADDSDLTCFPED